MSRKTVVCQPAVAACLPERPQVTQLEGQRPMSAAEIHVVAPGGEDDAASALCASHADYPAFREIFPDPARRAKALRPFMTATVRDAISFGLVLAARQDGQTLATAVWLPPGAFPWSIRRKLRAAPQLLLTMAAAPRSARRFMAYGANAEKAHPVRAHWYLEVLGVRPIAQRRGLGARLMEPVLERVDREQRTCYLETADRANVAYYERFGFRVEREELPLVPDGPPHVAMYRPPHRLSTVAGARVPVGERAP